MNIVPSARSKAKQSNRQTWTVKEQKGVKKGKKNTENDVMYKGWQRFEGSKRLGLWCPVAEGGPGSINTGTVFMTKPQGTPVCKFTCAYFPPPHPPRSWTYIPFQCDFVHTPGFSSCHGSHVPISGIGFY